MKWISSVGAACLLLLYVPTLAGQASPTATRTLQISAFGGLSGTDTGLFSGRNLGITAGVDLGFRPFHTFYPSLEVRGTYPVSKGNVDSERNILSGIKISKRYGRFHPYGDFLVGRGQINYGNGGYAAPDFQSYYVYVQSVSNVFSPGAGLDLQLDRQFSVKVDGQFQRYSSPVTDSGHLYSKSLTVGIVYRFAFDRKRR